MNDSRQLDNGLILFFEYTFFNPLNATFFQRIILLSF